MIWALLIAVAVLVVGAFAALLAGRIGYDPMATATTTAGDPRLGEGFHAHEVTGVRFDTAFRGYRMDQVDVVLDQLRDRIAQLEESATVDRADGRPAHPAGDRLEDPAAADAER